MLSKQEVIKIIADYKTKNMRITLLQCLRLLSLPRLQKKHIYKSVRVHPIVILFMREFASEQLFLYLSIIRDLYNNSIVAYKTGAKQSIHLVLNAIKEAKKRKSYRRAATPQ